MTSRPPPQLQPERVDLLAIVAHPDDAELICGGTLRRAADQGYRTGILNLTGGEMGTWGDPETRQAEADEAARILGLTVRRSAGLPDGAIENTPETRLIVAKQIRELRPRVVILHWPEGRHPDHRAASSLGYDACFIAGLRRAPIEGEPHRPHKVIYAMAYREEAVKPTFVVDISDQMEHKLGAIAAYKSQVEGKTALGEVFGGGDRPLRDQLIAHAAHYGSLIRRRFGEPFWTRETMLVDDVVRLDVQSI